MARRAKNTKALLLAYILLISLTFSIRSSAATSFVFKWTNVKQVEITAQKLNVRLGPSTAYRKIGSVSKGHVLPVLGTLESWYVVQMPDGSIGIISSTYTRVHAYYNPVETPSKPDSYGGPLTAEESLMVNLINTERKKVGLPAYEVNMELMRVARIKSEELSTKQYFSHESPVYGSPLKMLQDFSVHYSAASENIAGNQTIEAAHNSLMNSPSHKANILSTGYNYMGIGIVDDPRYGKVFVQLYIQNNKN